MAEKPQYSDAKRYAARGVSASKHEVHAAVDNLDHGLDDKTFCKITPDVLTGRPDYCNVIHSDGSGTKSTIAYLHYRECGDSSVFRGIAQDSIVMNVDDLLCIGATSNILISSTLNRNARNIPGDVVAELINGTEAFLALLRDQGVDIHSGGGETADVGDLTGTVTVDSCAVAVLPRSQIVSASNVVSGLDIIGFASYGQSAYETFFNSGIGSNGLTSARHDLLASTYRDKYPETFDPNTPRDLVYCGPFLLDDTLPHSDVTVGSALLSPTRTYAPLVVSLLKEFGSHVRGLVHCSGGGQTKCLRFGNAVHFVKEHFLPVPPIFQVIQDVSGTSWREMFQVYNMGHRMETFCPPDVSDDIIALANNLGIDAKVIGHTRPSEREDKNNHLTIIHDGACHQWPET